MPFLYYKLKILFYPLALFPDVSPMLVQLLQQEHPEHPPPHFPLPILFNCPRKIKNTINTNPVNNDIRHICLRFTCPSFENHSQLIEYTIFSDLSRETFSHGKSLVTSRFAGAFCREQSPGKIAFYCVTNKKRYNLLS